MYKYFFTVDVEVDKSSDWSVSNDFSFTSVEALQKGFLPDLLKKYQIKPILFISPEVLNDEGSVDILKNLPYESELATHLHTQFMRYSKNDYLKLAGTKVDEVQTDIDECEEADFLEKLTSLFYNCFGYSPVSFRSGRFSSRENTYKVLDSLGYKYTSNITPSVSWNYLSSSCDYTNYDCSVFKIFNTSITEFPITIQKGFLNTTKFKLLCRILARIKPELHGQHWLRPRYGTKKSYDFVINKTFPNDVVIMFHSNELTVGTSPYSKSIKEVIRWHNDLEYIIRSLTARGYKSYKFNDF